jgi:ribonuclease BN (tRNA processing enzyme)
LIDERITIDAGAVCRSLSLDEQIRIDHMLISHSHMDHVKDLALLADQVIGKRQSPVYLHCGPETAETLQSSYFNNYLWPDFTKIPTPENPVMKIVVHKPGRSFRIPGVGVGSATIKRTRNGNGSDGKKKSSKKGAKKASKKANGKADLPTPGDGEYDVTYVPVSHPVESMAMIIRGAGGSILYTSDTGPTTKLWQVANKQPDLKGLFVELSFPNHMQALADVAGHYTPRTLDTEMHKVDDRDEIPLFIYHLKPSFYEVTKNELMALRLKNMHLVELTDEFHF